MEIKITSSAFKPGGMIPVQYTCDGQDVSPPLSWIPAEENLDMGGTHGTNDFRRLGYGGPCPPGGTHRYFFKIYALDKKMDIPAGSTKARLLKAMEGHILAEGELMGRYKR